MSRVALILEGGGMRGAYTTGVLDLFDEKGLEFDACYAVSAGAGHACSFLSKQRGRAIRVNTSYLSNKNYGSIYSLIKTGSYFCNKFLYETIPQELDYFDYETFKNKKTKFYACVTNVETAQPEYLLIDDLHKDYMKIAASSSLPFISKIVEINGKKYLDGGIVDSVPINKAMADGYDKYIVVLTQHLGYQKPELAYPQIFNLCYHKYPAFIKAAIARPKNYNESLNEINQLGNEGRIFVIRPQSPLNIGRLEKDKAELLHLHDIGYQQTKDLYEQIINYINQ